MSKYRQLLYGHPVPQSFFDALQEFMGSAANNFALTLVPSGQNNQIQVAAGSANEQVGIAIDGLWRYNATTVATAITGAAGTYNVFVTCSNNEFATNPDPPPPEIDSTVYSFGLVATTAASPTGVAHYRKIGEAVFDGAKITSLRQLVGQVDTSGVFQPGDMKVSFAQSPPAGWLLCNGAQYATLDYPALFAAIGYTFGGSGAAFNVPDARGRTILGAGQGAGLTNRPLGTPGGSETVVLATAHLPAHLHAVSLAAANHNHTFSGTVANHVHQVYGSTAAASLSHTHGAAALGAFVNADGSLMASNVWNNPQAGHTLGVYANSVARTGTTAAADPQHGHSMNFNSQGAAPAYSGTTSAVAPAVTGNTANTGSGTAHDNMQPFLAANVLIKT